MKFVKREIGRSKTERPISLRCYVCERSDHAHEHLDGLVFGHAEFVVLAGGVLCAVLGTLPELAVVLTGEGHDVLLREVAEDGMTLLDELVGAEGYGHVDHAEVPLLPCAAVEPDVALLGPVIVFHHIPCSEHGLDTYAVCAVRVGEVASGIDLVGLHLAEEVYHDVDVGFAELALLDAARLIEGEVEEVGIGLVVEAEGAYGCFGFGAADGALEVEQCARLGLALYR